LENNQMTDDNSFNLYRVEQHPNNCIYYISTKL
jgi:hypothetical protein